MRTLPCALSLLTIASCTGKHPDISSCDELPGFCHKRTSKDVEYVKWWNENKGPGNNSGNGNEFKLRRHLPEVVGTPIYVPFSPGEYETVQGILLAFDGSSNGGSTYDLDVVAGIAAAVTNPDPQDPTILGADVFMVANSNQQPVAETAFANAGVNMNRVVWIEENIDSVWIRDYGPRFICDPDTDIRAAVDTAYYSSRQLDNNLPVELGNVDRLPIGFGHDNHNLNRQLLHSGGNAHYFSTNEAFATTLLDDDNRKLKVQRLKDIWMDYHGAELHLFDQLSFSVDGTGHIDMWFLPVSNTAVIIGEWATEDNYGSKAITDGAAQYMISKGYTVYRTPNWNTVGSQFSSSVHYTYTNAVIANDVVVISAFNIEPYDTDALDTFQLAFPEKKILQVDSSEIIKRSGALHCIVQHVYDCSVPLPPQDPIAVASADPQSVSVAGSVVTLDGTSSYDPDGTILDYVWTSIDGTQLTSAVGTVNVDTLPVTYTLTVTDASGATGTDSVEITLGEPGPTCIEPGFTCTGGRVCCNGTCPPKGRKVCPN